MVHVPSLTEYPQAQSHACPVHSQMLGVQEHTTMSCQEDPICNAPRPHPVPVAFMPPLLGCSLSLLGIDVDATFRVLLTVILILSHPMTTSHPKSAAHLENKPLSPLTALG